MYLVYEVWLGNHHPHTANIKIRNWDGWARSRANSATWKRWLTSWYPCNESVMFNHGVRVSYYVRTMYEYLQRGVRIRTPRKKNTNFPDSSGL